MAVTRTKMSTSFKKIKIPAYISEPITSSAEVVQTNAEMISPIVARINAYNNLKEDDKIAKPLRGKSIVKHIYHVNFDLTLKDGTTDLLLLRIIEKKKGFTDMAIESLKVAKKMSTDGSDTEVQTTDDKSIGAADKVEEAENKSTSDASSEIKTTEVKSDDNITSNQNCAIMYPIISRKRDVITNNWIIFVYVDPGKTDTDVISTVKTVLTDILDLKIKNVKTNEANAIIKKEGIVSKLEAQYIVITNNENEYLDIGGKKITSTVKEITTITYEKVPADKAAEYVNHKNDRKYDERKVSLTFPKQKLKYQHKNDADQNTVKEAIEQSFNYEIDIAVDEMDNMYESSVILKHVKGAAIQYFTNQ